MALADEAGDSALAALTAASVAGAQLSIGSGFDAARADGNRRATTAARCADLQVRARVHLTIGRLERRVDDLHDRTYDTSQLQGKCLLAIPTSVIASSLDLDESSVLASIRRPSRGHWRWRSVPPASAAESGWTKGKRRRSSEHCAVA